MPESVPLTTCLSPTVYKMVCELGFEAHDSVEISDILDSDNRVCWHMICGKVSHLCTGQRLDYAESVRQLGPLCDAIHTHLMSLPNEKYEEAFQDCFQWTNNCELFLTALAVLKSLDGTQISLHLMKMTSCLEFSLGDVYLTVGKNCPFLLRDLLASEELAKIFSKPVMDLLRVFLGSPESLNLRNILWHGFASPQEIPFKYCSMLLLLTAGLGQLLQMGLGTRSTIVHRPHFVFHNVQEMQVFSGLDEEVLSLAEKLIKKSQFVLPHMAPFWIEAITAFRQGRYADCAILSLSQLEACLRLIFATVNDCPHRMLTAESSTLYTTFDEVLAKHLNNASDNQVPETLGEPAMEFLWDYLNHQEGPRLRDHLSHGEIQLSEFPKQFANDLLGFSAVFLYKQLGEEHFDKEMTVLYPLIDVAESYRSRFHPIALLHKQVLQCSESLQEWQLLPFPSPDHETIGPEDQDNPDKSLQSEMTQIISLLQFHKKTCFSVEDLDSLLETDRWFVSMKVMCNKKISNLYCHRWVLEAVNILRKVSTQCLLVSNNIVSTAQLRYDQWMNKTLRSRQRQNYLRMLRSMNSLSSVVRLILTLVVVILHNMHSISKKTLMEYQKYLKFLKSILQYAENISTCTNAEKNRWDEAIQLTCRIMIKIRMFIEKFNLE